MLLTSRTDVLSGVSIMRFWNPICIIPIIYNKSEIKDNDIQYHYLPVQIIAQINTTKKESVAMVQNK